MKVKYKKKITVFILGHCVQLWSVTVDDLKRDHTCRCSQLQFLNSPSTVFVEQGRGALQDIDQMSLFKPLCKFCASIRTIREIIPTMRKALAIAQSGTPGPVFIEFPIDTLYPYHLISQEFGAKNPPKGLMGKIVSWYVISLSCLVDTEHVL